MRTAGPWRRALVTAAQRLFSGAPAPDTVHERHRWSADHGRRGTIPHHKLAARARRSVGHAHRRDSARHELERAGDRCRDPHLSPNATDLSEASVIELGPGERHLDVTIVLAHGHPASLSGLALLADGSPAVGASVNLRGEQQTSTRRQLRAAPRINDGRVRTIPPRQRHAGPLQQYDELSGTRT